MSEISGADQAYSDVFESYEGTVQSSPPVKSSPQVRKVYIYELCLPYSLRFARPSTLPALQGTSPLLMESPMQMKPFISELPLGTQTGPVVQYE